MDIPDKIKETIIEQTIEQLPKELQAKARIVFKDGDEKSLLIQIFGSTMKSTSDALQVLHRNQLGALKTIIAYLLVKMDDQQFIMEDSILQNMNQYDVSLQKTTDGDCLVKLKKLN